MSQRLHQGNLNSSQSRESKPHLTAIVNKDIAQSLSNSKSTHKFGEEAQIEKLSQFDRMRRRILSTYSNQGTIGIRSSYL